VALTQLVGMNAQMQPWLSLVGIGDDGLAGLGEPARAALVRARTLIGGRRHLALLPDPLAPGGAQQRIPWPSPFASAFEMLLARRGTPVCVLASGDPMWFGIGASLARMLPAEEFRVYPAPSSFTLAAARLGWPLQDAGALSVHGRPLEALHPQIHPDARLLILSENGQTPAAIARLLRERGFGPSRLCVLEHLGGPSERRLDGHAADWPFEQTADLNLVAVHCRPDPDAARLSTLAGLADAAFAHDGQLTKRHVRAATLAHLAPSPGEFLWDVGAGCGSIGIEWMRCHPSCRAVAIEADAERCRLIERNRRQLGVPGLQIVSGRAPEMLRGLDPPDAVFVGGGLTEPDLLRQCWDALPPGGRLVANAVTLQSETILAAWRQRTGGELARISVAHAAPLGRFDGWRTAMPVTMLAATKPPAPPAPPDTR
jgi:precorrin-6B C5,15-methyltransferase / cobalt-precorrin-6B C5,C15-methyltransferase